MDVATIGALGTIVVGIAAAGAALIGQRGANRANREGAVLGLYDSLTNNLQEELARYKAEVAEKNQELAAAYAELARERSDKTALRAEITALQTERTELLERIARLEGRP